MGFRLYPVSVRVYSTFGGTCGYILRVIRPACSMALRWLVRTFWVMPFTDRMSSLNRFVPVSKSRMMRTFHLSPISCKGHFHRTIRYFHCVIHSVSPPWYLYGCMVKKDVSIIIYLYREFDNGRVGPGCDF